jgi:hypothetical protein
MKKQFLLLLLSTTITVSASAYAKINIIEQPKQPSNNFTIKSNLLYGAIARSPNIAFEVGLNRNTTLNLSAGYNWFNLTGRRDDNKKLNHWLIQPELRYFIEERLNGHYIGVHSLFAHYNIGGHERPMLLGKGSKDYRYFGNAYGGGLSYGYQLRLSQSFGVEFTAGVGYIRMNYDKYGCKSCANKLTEGETRNYLGPSKAGISLIFFIK